MNICESMNMWYFLLRTKYLFSKWTELRKPLRNNLAGAIQLKNGDRCKKNILQMCNMTSGIWIKTYDHTNYLHIKEVVWYQNASSTMLVLCPVKYHKKSHTNFPNRVSNLFTTSMLVINSNLMNGQKSVS